MPPIVPPLARADVLAATASDLATLGLVGETDAALLVYVAYSSRKLARPLSVIVKGPSGSGKDQVQRIPARLIPPADVIDVMSVTPNALYYGEPGWLQNKVLLGGERRHEDSAEARDRTAAIRQMISQGYISKATVESRKDEGHQTRLLEQEGPISYSETTTQDSIFREDANRCLQVTTNPTREHTRAILDSVASSYLDGAGSEKRRREAIKRHHDFQDWLKPVVVKIPFASAVSHLLPDDTIDIRRVVGQLFTVVECVTYLNQGRRERRKDGSILATLDDYAAARRLSSGPLAESRKAEGKDAKLLEALPEEFSTCTAAEAWEDAFRSQTNRTLTRLREGGLVEKVCEGSGPQAALWRKTGKTAPSIALPTVEEVRASLDD